MSQTYVCPGCETSEKDAQAYDEALMAYNQQNQPGVKVSAELRDSVQALGLKAKRRLECLHPEHFGPVGEQSTAETPAGDVLLAQKLCLRAGEIQDAATAEGEPLTFEEALEVAVDEMMPPAEAEKPASEKPKRSRPSRAKKAAEPEQPKAGGEANPARDRQVITSTEVGSLDGLGVVTDTHPAKGETRLKPDASHQEKP